MQTLVLKCCPAVSAFVSKEGTGFPLPMSKFVESALRACCLETCLKGRILGVRSIGKNFRSLFRSRNRDALAILCWCQWCFTFSSFQQSDGHLNEQLRTRKARVYKFPRSSPRDKSPVTMSSYVTGSTLPTSPDDPSDAEFASRYNNNKTLLVNNRPLAFMVKRSEWASREDLLAEISPKKPLFGASADTRSYDSADCPLPHGVDTDFVPISVASEDDIHHHHLAPSDDGSVQQTPSYREQFKESVELLLTFVAVVALWGVIDVTVDMISGDSLPMELLTYLMFAAVAIFVQMACNKLCNSNMSFIKALDRF
eukprot:Blabericola_migrator_1__1163@NODE_12_length_24658_cov_176_683258_g9_i0_p10_GENE_NODE_12_length_24658_cov_176_683258_g9_i0NODE_12_length_24658_cov_176_683258_g9_i0_p10_ORF_typecomplete_len312_score34_46DUF4134/PF13572_6/0_16DUF1003/PF06210_11/0_43_NODE_12_length_24658_cov_176_683258_g9_i01054111476